MPAASVYEKVASVVPTGKVLPEAVPGSEVNVPNKPVPSTLSENVGVA